MLARSFNIEQIDYHNLFLINVLDVSHECLIINFRFGLKQDKLEHTDDKKVRDALSDVGQVWQFNSVLAVFSVSFFISHFIRLTTALLRRNQQACRGGISAYATDIVLSASVMEALYHAVRHVVIFQLRTSRIYLQFSYQKSLPQDLNCRMNR